MSTFSGRSSGVAVVRRRKHATSVRVSVRAQEQTLTDSPSFLTDRSAVTWQKIDDVFVVLPKETPQRNLPKGIIYFLGGAFIGAVPDRTYRSLVSLLAAGGYLVLPVPYSVTFDHSRAAADLQRTFCTARGKLTANGRPERGWTGRQLADLPVYGVGHSNGALMHVLSGCLFEPESLPVANVLVSFNNRPVSEAVPFFNEIGPAFKSAAPAIESFPLTGIALSLAEQALGELSRSPLQLPAVLSSEDLQGLARFADQIGPVFGQVREGVSEFRPTPSENRRSISTSYGVSKNLLVKFSDDMIDETDTLKALLDIRMREVGGTAELFQLNGTHVTPLSQDFLQAGDVYTPLDAIGQFAQSMALTDLRTLANKITQWLDAL